jgi:hypothetical protein
MHDVSSRFASVNQPVWALAGVNVLVCGGDSIQRDVFDGGCGVRMLAYANKGAAKSEQ